MTAARIVVDLDEVCRIARDVVDTTPAPQIPAVLVERLKAMRGEATAVREKPRPTDAQRATIARKFRKYRL